MNESNQGEREEGEGEEEKPAGTGKIKAGRVYCYIILLFSLAVMGLADDQPNNQSPITLFIYGKMVK